MKSEQEQYQMLAAIVQTGQVLKNKIAGAGVIRGRDVWLLLSILSGPPEGIKVSDLAARMNVTPSAISQAISSLEKRGMVCRFNDPRDRRVCWLRIPEDKKEMLLERKQLIRDTICPFMDSLDPDDRAAFFRVIKAAQEWFGKEKQ